MKRKKATTTTTTTSITSTATTPTSMLDCLGLGVNATFYAYCCYCCYYCSILILTTQYIHTIHQLLVLYLCSHICAARRLAFTHNANIFILFILHYSTFLTHYYLYDEHLYLCIQHIALFQMLYSDSIGILCWCFDSICFQLQ